MSEIHALLFGAVIVCIFSYERFNRTTYDVGKRLERLVTLLSPDKLRARRVVRQAWVFYTLALLLLYAVLCVYGKVLPAIGMETSVGASDLPNSDEGGSIGIPPSVSLSVALLLTGLAPSFPVAQRVEEWMRVTAHRLAGIPTRVLSDTDDLRRNAISLATDKGDSLLIPRGDWDRRVYYAMAASDQVTAPEDFGNDIDLIFAISSWILDRRLKLANIELRERFQPLEDELRNRKDVLVLELDERTGFVLGRGSHHVDKSAQSLGDEEDVSELKRRSWDRVASDADALAEDLCILLALYVEHGFISRETVDGSDFTTTGSVSAEAVGFDQQHTLTQDTTRRLSIRQQDIARKKLHDFLQEIRSSAIPERMPSFTTLALFWSLFLIMTVTVIWSQWPGKYEFELRFGGPFSTPYQRAVDMGVVALNGFFVPMLIALSLRDAGRQSKIWKNIWRAHWTTYLPRVCIVLFASWALAMVLVVALSFWQVALQQDISQNANWFVIRTAFERDVVVMLRGSILALIVICLLDGHAARVNSLKRMPSWKASRQWGLWTAAIMGAIGALARTAQSLVAARVAQPQRLGLDRFDYGLIFYSTVYSALIGFVVVYFLTEVLLNQWPIHRHRPHQKLAYPVE